MTTPPTDQPREAAAMSDCQLAESERLGDYTKLGTFGDMAEAIRNLVSEVRRLRAASAPPLPTAADAEARASQWQHNRMLANNGCTNWVCDTYEAFLAGARSEAERTGEMRADHEHALREAKRRDPDYPWTQNTMSEAVWALGESLVGVRAANDDLHERIKQLTADRDRLDAELRQAREAIAKYSIYARSFGAAPFGATEEEKAALASAGQDAT